MSTEPLLPSYTSITPQQCRQNGDQSAGAGRDNISATPIIQCLSLLIFAGTAIISTVWARRSYTTPDLIPPESAPLLPYFASLCLIISFGCWVGYIVFISYDTVGGPRAQRKIVIWTFAVGKLILAGAHIGFGLSYKYSFPDSVQPNWEVFFLAAQAWWDFLLRVVYSRLRALKYSK